MYGSKQYRRNAERGISLVGLIVLFGVIGAIAVLGMKVFPTWSEFMGIKRSIAVAKASNGTPREMQLSFDKNADINYVTSITSKDLVISNANGELDISFS